MFGLISKKKLLKKLDDLQISNNKESIYACYKEPITSDQKILNSYSQGYEDGCDNICNCLRGLAK